MSVCQKNLNAINKYVKEIFIEWIHLGDEDENVDVDVLIHYYLGIFAALMHAPNVCIGNRKTANKNLHVRNLGRIFIFVKRISHDILNKHHYSWYSSDGNGIASCLYVI